MLHQSKRVQKNTTGSIGEANDDRGTYLLLSSTQSGLTTTMSNLRGKKQVM
jgi:hypothetical protein